MMRMLAIAVLMFAAVPAPAGIYSPTANSPFEFGPDGKPKALWPTQFDELYNDRIDTMNPATPKERAKTRVETLKRIEERKAQAAPPNPEFALAQSADLLAVGQTAEAIKLLRGFDTPGDFRLQANTVQAHALSFDWLSAMENELYPKEAEASAVTPELRWRFSIEKQYTRIWLRYHLDLVRKKTDPATLKPIPLFGDGPLPAEAVAIAQQMALDAPTDNYLLWALAETNAKAGDYRTAAKLFDRCTNNGFTQPTALMARRAEVQDIVSKLPKLEEKALVLPSVGPPTPTTPATPKGLFDLISPEKFYILGGSFALIAVALLALQVRAVQRKRRRRIV